MSPYDILEISSRATEEEVRAAYKAMAKKWHPDRMLDDQETATRKFMDISSAYRAILHERRREARKHSPSSSSSTSPQRKFNSASSSSADRPGDSRHSSRSSSSQKHQRDYTRSAGSKEKTKNGDTSHDGRRCQEEGGSSSKESSLEGSKNSSDPAKSARSDPTRSPRSRSSRESSPSSSSSRSSSTSRSSKILSSKPSSSASSCGSDASTENLSTASSRTSVGSSSTDTLPEQGQKHGREHHRDHYAHQPDSNGSTPSFTSYTSSEASAYDNPEITPPGVSRNDPPRKQETKSLAINDTGTSSPPPRPPDDSKPKSSRREKDHPSKMRKGEEEHEERTLIPEYDSPLARAVGVSKEWTYTIRLTLEELFYGKKLRFRVLRCKLDGKRKTVILDVDVPPGSVHGTQIIFRGAGHERKDGTRQDIVFIIEEAKHERFVRVKEDLMLDVRLPWVEGLKKEAAVVYAKGLDGRESSFEVNFAGEGNVTGTAVIPGAGMPVPGTDRRGMLVVRWEIYMPSTTSRWGALKQALSL